ncbi:MAG TPA: DUF1839 family protein [Solirubrobacteraceae bacterium]
MAAPTTGFVSLFGLDPATYVPHPIHAGAHVYGETNCYADVLIELLHARGDEPLAVLGSVLRMDFEGDQWTFFKPAPEDLELLLGIDVHEMQPYRPLPDQIAEQLAVGRTLIVELDSFHLPDTASTSYGTEHVKSSVAAEAIDVCGQRLRYFHNGGLHELAGEDFREVFRLGRSFSPDILPPYTELVRFDRGSRLTGGALREGARERVRHHLGARPAANPFPGFGAQLEEQLPLLLEGDAAGYHAYAFATVRMVGAGFEVAASLTDWLLGSREAQAAAAFRRIVDEAKVLSFKLARRRAFDVQPTIAALGSAWDEATTRLDDALG